MYVSVPSSVAALPPSVDAASKDVPRTVRIFIGSLHFTVLRAFPIENRKQEKFCGRSQILNTWFSFTDVPLNAGQIIMGFFR